MPETRPVSDQIRFKSSTTGEHNLDTYLEAAEKGGRTVAALLDDIFDTNGNVDAGFVSFRVNATTFKLQYQPGPSTGNTGFIDTDTFVFRLKGNWAANVDYKRLDLVTHNNNLYIANEDHNSGATGLFADTATSWQTVAAASTLIANIDAKQDELEETKSEAYYHALERKSDGSLEWFTGNGPDTVAEYQGFQKHDTRKRHPRIQRIPLMMKYRLQVGTGSIEPNNFARSTSSNYMPHQNETDTNGHITYQTTPTRIGSFTIPYLPRNAAFNFQYHQGINQNDSSGSYNIYCFIRSRDNSKYELPWGYEARDYDNWTRSQQWYIGYSRLAGSGNLTKRTGYTGNYAPVYSAMIPQITDHSQIPHGYNRIFDWHVLVEYSNASSYDIDIRGDLMPLICWLEVEDLDYDLETPDDYYDGGVNDEYNFWDVRNWHDHAITSNTTVLTADHVNRYHINQVDKLRKDAPLKFQDDPNKYYTSDYDVEFMGGSDQRYYLDGGNLHLRLGEHKYPRFQIKYLIDNGTPVFWVNGTAQKTLTLVRGNIYDFEYVGDMQSNRFRLSTTADGTHATPTPGVLYQADCTFNAAASLSRIKVTSSTPNTLYYFSEDNAGKGGTINVVNDDYLPS